MSKLFFRHQRHFEQQLVYSDASVLSIVICIPRQQSNVKISEKIPQFCDVQTEIFLNQWCNNENSYQKVLNQSTQVLYVFFCSDTKRKLHFRIHSRGAQSCYFVVIQYVFTQGAETFSFSTDFFLAHVSTLLVSALIFVFCIGNLK